MCKFLIASTLLKFQKLYTFTLTMEFDPFKYPISKLNELKPTKGRVLISEPFMMDKYFKRSVVFLTEHNKDGSVGFVLNKLLDVKINELVTDFPDFNAEVHMGGPVQSRNLYYLHTRGDLFDDCVKIIDGVYWNGDFEKLKEHIEGGRISEEEIIFFLGYSGWDEGQLSEELTENSWLVQEITADLLFSKSEEDLWKRVIRASDSRIAPMADFPEDPTLN